MTTNHRRRWTPEEDARLAIEMAEAGAERVAARMGRSVHAVHNRIGEIGLRTYALRRVAAGLSMAGVAAGLGVAAHQVNTWVDSGWLRVTVVRAGKRRWWSFAVDAVADFLSERGALLRYLQPDDFWRSIVHECRADLEARLVASRAVQQALGFVNASALSYLRQRKGFPPLALYLGVKNGGGWYERSAVTAWLAAHPQYVTRATEALLPVRHSRAP